MAWTDERIERLKTLWAEGLSASQIASQLGEVTRNAVIGKIHRLGLSGRGAPARPRGEERPQPRKPRPPERLAAPTRPVPALHRALSVGNTVLKAVPLEDEPEAQPLGAAEVVVLRAGVTLAELGPSSCRWPVGDPAREDFRFCGQRSEPGQPYCCAHQERAFQGRPARVREERG